LAEKIVKIMIINIVLLHVARHMSTEW